MKLNNFLKLNQDASSLLILIVISFLARLPVIIFYGDSSTENEWTTLLHYLVNHNILALQEFDNFILPNLLMPPLYAYYLYAFTFLNYEVNNFVLLILFSQSVLASISIGVFYKINSFFFNRKISFYSSLIFSLLPIYLYSCSQISSASLTIFLAILFYYYFFKITNSNTFLNLFIMGIIGGLLILISREFTLIIIISSFYLFWYSKISFKNFFLIILVSLLVISPYLVRNYLIFDKIIIHSSFGFNLWKGNNQNSKVEGSDMVINELKSKINNVTKDKFYRINEDKIYVNEAINNIKEDPERYLILYLKRTVSYFFIDIDSTYPNYYHPIHYLPILVISITSLIGAVLSDKKSYRLNYIILIVLFYIFVFSFFAILPRYKLYIIPLQIILSNVFIDYVIKKIKNKTNNSYD